MEELPEMKEADEGYGNYDPADAERNQPTGVADEDGEAFAAGVFVWSLDESDEEISSSDTKRVRLNLRDCV